MPVVSFSEGVEDLQGLQVACLVLLVLQSLFVESSLVWGVLGEGFLLLGGGGAGGVLHDVFGDDALFPVLA